MGVLVGLGAGLGAVAFRYLINGFTYVFFDVVRPALAPALGPAAVVPLPALGGLLFGPLIYFFAREAKGHGVPEVMLAVAQRGGRIRPAVAVVKALASALCIGSGGSVGREGPIVQIGSALGSTVGQVFRMSDDRVRTLVACGAAGGIAATFNAPIAGVFFALEVILGEFTTRAFGVVVISSVTASVIGRAAFGDVAAFPVPAFQLVNVGEFGLYALLAVIAGALGVGFSRTLYAFEDWFDAIPMREYLKPVPGGLVLGGLGLFLPQVFGVGYPAMDSALRGDYGLALLADPGCGQDRGRFGHDRVGRLGWCVRAIAVYRGDAGHRLRHCRQLALPGRRGTRGRLRSGWHGGRLRRRCARADHVGDHSVRAHRRLPHHPAADAGRCAEHARF